MNKSRELYAVKLFFLNIRVIMTVIQSIKEVLSLRTEGPKFHVLVSQLKRNFGRL